MRERFGASGVSIFPTNIPYSMGSRSELLRVSQTSNSIWMKMMESANSTIISCVWMCMIWWDRNGIYLMAIKHGVLENPPFRSMIIPAIAFVWFRLFPASRVWWHRRVPPKSHVQKGCSNKEQGNRVYNWQRQGLDVNDCWLSWQPFQQFQQSQHEHLE